jgi:hypothetical protein
LETLLPLALTLVEAQVLTLPAAIARLTSGPAKVLGQDLGAVARNLYAGLRALDSAGVDVILAPRIAPSGIGEALADRLSRAAAKRNPIP